MKNDNKSREVFNLMLNRRSALRDNRPCEDSRDLWLVIPVGGMNGTIIGGALTGLQELGFLNTIDGIACASSGAISAPYLVTGQVIKGTKGYWEFMPKAGTYPGQAGEKFIDFLRPIRYVFAMLKGFFKKGVTMPPTWRIAWLHRLIYEVMDHPMENLLNWDKIITSEINHKGRLVVVTTDALSGEPIYVKKFSQKIIFQKVLEATCCIPFAAEGPIKFTPSELLEAEFTLKDGTRMLDTMLSLFDGGVIQPLPVQAALDHGATDLIVVNDRAKNATYSPTNFKSLSNLNLPRKIIMFLKIILMELLTNTLVWGFTRKYPKIYRHFKRRGEARKSTIKSLEKGIISGNVHSLVIYPLQERLGRFEMAESALAEGAEAGFKGTLATFGVDSDILPPPPIWYD
jgi:predicted acylesterase/phospholipase RssA